jgi:SUN domain-containing protein 1/2
MSQLGGMGATPARRSARLSQAGSVTNQSAFTSMTTGGTRQRKKGPLTKVKPRKSNAYGASGRVGAAEELSVSATGFAQAFQNQRGDAVARDDGDEDDIDELGGQTPRMSGALNGRVLHHSPSPEPEAPTPRAPGLSFEESEDNAPSENGIAASIGNMSIGNTSKSFGLIHEAGMLFRPPHQESSRPSSEEPWTQPLWQKNRARRMQAQAIEQEQEEVEIAVQEVQATPATQAAQTVQAVQDRRPKQITPAKNTSPEQSIVDIVAQERARLRREGPPQPLPKPYRPTRRQQPNSSHVDEWLGNVEQDQEDKEEWTWKKVTKLLVCGMIALLALTQIAGFLMSNQYPESTPRAGMMTAINTRVSRAWYDVADWIMPDEGMTQEEKDLEKFKLGDGSLDDNFMWTHMKRLYGELDGRIGGVRDTINDLKEQLPEYMVVRHLPNGKREITDDFWNALVAKAKSSENANEWVDYLKRNQDKLRDIFGVISDSQTSNSRPEAISRQEFLNLVQQQYKTMSAQVDEKVFEKIQSQAPQIKAIAQAEARKTLVESIQLDTLAQSNLLTNYELNLRKPNYFSLGLGAVIDPTLTSATFADDSRPYANIARRFALARLRNPPRAALDRWEEPGDCWCAAPNPSKNGQAQLTVTIPYPVFPEQVTIEHLPMSMMPAKKITNAPRTVELWVETDERAQYHYSHKEGDCQQGPAGWTCLGSFNYNIHASNHQQTFDLDARSSVPVTRAMLRVTSNWGADHTCLYRVRLHGRDVSGDHQYGVHLKDPVQ